MKMGNYIVNTKRYFQWGRFDYPSHYVMFLCFDDIGFSGYDNKGQKMENFVQYPEYWKLENIVDNENWSEIDKPDCIKE